jgi:DNA polymerase
MNTITLDFETYYSSKTFSLSKLGAQEYVLSPQFQTIGVGIDWGNSLQWHTHADIDAAMATLRSMQGSLIVVCHNAMFDAAVLAWKYDVHPAYIVDTLSLARSVGLQATVGGSLSALADQMRAAGIQCPPKGAEVATFDGYRLETFRPDELERYGRYCLDDVRITKALFDYLRTIIPPEEMLWQSDVMKMYTERRLFINAGVVAEELARVKARRKAAMDLLLSRMGGDASVLTRVLNSNPQFAEFLQLMGADVPMKLSKATGLETYAFSKTDVKFLEMVDHPIPEVAALVEARLGLKSSIEETRCETFLKLADAGPLPVPYQVSGAKTHRLAGSDGFNLQNLPSGRKEGQSKALRTAIEAPVGYVLVGCDSGQVEVRVADYIAGARQGIEDFRNGVCPYSSLAARMFGEGEAEQIKRDAKAGVEPWAMRRQVAKSARLGAQFGIGPPKFVDYCKTQAGLTITPQEGERYVYGFRNASPEIQETWKLHGKVLAAMVRGEHGYFGGLDNTLLWYDGARYVMGVHMPGVRLPDGMWLSYPGLTVKPGDKGPSYSYTNKRGKGTEEVYIYGGKFFENTTQALAFSVMKYQATLLNYPLVLNSHDEHVILVKESEVTMARENIEWAMRQTPPWAPGLPLDCESKVGRNYGDLK